MSLPAFFLVNAVWLKVIKTRSKQMATKVCCCFKIGNKTLKWCVVHIYLLFARVCITFLGIYMFFIFYNKYTYVFYIYIYTKRLFPSCLSDTSNPCFLLSVSEPSKKGGSKLGDER